MDYLYGLLDSEEMYRIPADMRNRFAKLTLSKKKELRKSLEANLEAEEKSPQCKTLSENILREILTDDSSESEAEELNKLFNSSSSSFTNGNTKLDRSELKPRKLLLDNINLLDSDETHCSLVEKNTNDEPCINDESEIFKTNMDKTEDMERLQFSFTDISKQNTVTDSFTMDVLSQKVSSLGICSPLKTSIPKINQSPEKTQVVSVESERKSSGNKIDFSSEFPILKVEPETPIKEEPFPKMEYRFDRTILTISSLSKNSNEESEYLTNSENSDDDEVVIVVSDSDNSALDTLGEPPKKPIDSSDNCSEQISEIRASGQTFLPSTMSNDKADRLEAFLNDLPSIGQEHNSFYDNENMHDSLFMRSTDDSTKSDNSINELKKKSNYCYEESIEIAETSTEPESKETTSEEIIEASIQNQQEGEIHLEKNSSIGDNSPTIEDCSPLIQNVSSNKNNDTNPNPSSPHNKLSSSSSSSEYEQISISAKFNIKIHINSQPKIVINENQDSGSSATNSENNESVNIPESRQSEIYQENQKAIQPLSIVENLPENISESTSFENIDTKAKEILTKLYGNQWQTPENIRKLDRTINSTSKKQLLNNFNVSRNLLNVSNLAKPLIKSKNNEKDKSLCNKNFNNENDIFKVPSKVNENKVKIKNSNVENIHNETSIADFTTFHKNIRNDLESTRLNICDKLENKNSVKPISEYKLPLTEKKIITKKDLTNQANPISLTEKPKSKYTRSGRQIKPIILKQLNYDDDDPEQCIDDDSEADATYEISTSKNISSKLSSELSDGSYSKKSPSKEKKLTKRCSKKKNKSKSDDDIVYLDLSHEIIKVQENYMSPPAEKDPRFSEQLNSLLKTCTFQPKKPLEFTPSTSTKRKLFTPRFGDEEEVLPPDSPLRQLKDDVDDFHVNLQLPSIFAIPINKKLESVKTGTPIFKIPTPKKNKEYDSPKSIKEKENDSKICNTTPKNNKTPKTPKQKVNLIEEDIPEDTPLNKYGFLKSLDVMVPKSRCHPDALIYRDSYKNNKEELAQRLYKLYNKKLFNNELNVLIIWNKKLINTAGRCSNKKKGSLRSSVIELSEKVLTSADRLRCTLIHELCHAATWIFNGEHGHGAIWKNWAQKANFIFQELPKIGVCHSYDIEYKYTYKCILCQAKSHAHSKSKKVENIRCAYCHGAIEIFLNKKDREGNIVSTPVKEPTGFAKFVKDHYKKFQTPDLKHRDVMKLLSTEFATLKVDNGK